MTNRTMIRAGTACLTVAAALVAAPAFAQDSAAGTEEDDGAIVVTVPRREERLLDAPVSIAALGAARITATGARDVAIGRPHVCTIVTRARFVCRLPLAITTHTSNTHKSAITTRMHLS